MATVNFSNEAPRKGWLDNLKDLVGGIDQYRAQNPVQIPYPEGTPTVDAIQQQEIARHNSADETIQGIRAAADTIRANKEGSTTQLKTKTYSALLQRAQADVDGFWKASGPNGPTQEAAEQKISQIEREYLQEIPRTLADEGFTPLDIYKMGDELRLGAGLKPKFITSYGADKSGQLTPEDIQKLSGQNPQ